MSTAKVTVSINQSLLNRIDQLVKSRVFRSRSQVIQEAVKDMISRFARVRLAIECAKLDKQDEQFLADKGLAADIEDWPEY